MQEEQAKQEAEAKKATEDSEDEDAELNPGLADRIIDFFERPALGSIKPYVQVLALCLMAAHAQARPWLK